MDSSNALRIIEALACGVDPITGERLPDGSPVHHPEVIRALFTATRLMESADESRVKSCSDPRPARAGEAWEPEEDQRLLEEFDAGAPFSKMARAHQRSRGGIVSRLVRLGRLQRKPDSSSRDKGKSENSDGSVEKWWRKERPQTGKPWTEKEDAELRKYVSTGMTIEDMAERLGRGNHAVDVRLCKLGLFPGKAPEE